MNSNSISVFCATAGILNRTRTNSRTAIVFEILIKVVEICVPAYLLTFLVLIEVF